MMAKAKVVSKLFWAWVAVEVFVTGWIGWQIAKAEEHPWSVPGKKKK